MLVTSPWSTIPAHVQRGQRIMAPKKIIAVVGATGAQGGGLCDAILSDASGEFACRAITRDPEKDKAKALAARGAQVVRADLDDVESLKAAFAGAYGIYCVTNFWEHFSAEKEKQQASNLAEAARASGAEHVIWSTLEDTRAFMSPDDTRMPMLQTHYRVPHFDAKGEANKFFAGIPTTFLIASFYWDNLYASGVVPRKGEDGTYRWALPMSNKRLSGIAAEDIGKVAYGIFKAGKQYVGQTVGIASEHLTISEMGEKLARAKGVPSITHQDVTPDQYRAFGFPGADEMGNMMQVYRDFETEIVGRRDPALARKLAGSILTFDQFLNKYKDRIQL
jgi:uncharacterized protein YbjT (DUF2867 family)